MAGPASHEHDQDYHKGEMDIAEQRSTFALIMGIAKWGAFLSAVVILFFTMWLYPRGNFMGAAVATLILIVAGIFLLGRKRSGAH